MGGLRFRLRDATASAHRRVEAVMALDERCQSSESYRILLARLWGLYAPLEAALGRVDWADAELAFVGRAKLGWLEADLRDMGMAESSLAILPRAPLAQGFDNRLEALGALYVVEGASLGGQIISRRLTANLGVTAEHGGRFFASYGREVGARWRDYLSVLERFANDAAAAGRIERSALATFDCFLTWFAAESREARLAADVVS